MTTTTMATGTRTMETTAKTRRSLEELVDRLMATLVFPDGPESHVMAGSQQDPARQPRRSLEELVDRLMATLVFPDGPESHVMAGSHQDPARQPRRSLEELVDRLMATLVFPDGPESHVMAGSHQDPARQPRRSLEELVDRLMATLVFPDGPESHVMAGSHQDPARQPRRSLEELVNRIMATLTFRVEPEPASVAASTGLVRDIHRTRRHRQEGDLDGALDALAGAVPTSAAPQHARWAFSEWRQLVSKRFGHRDPFVYSQEMGRASALVPRSNDLLEVVAVLGMSWRPGKLVSRRSLRGLRSPMSSMGQVLGRSCP